MKLAIQRVLSDRRKNMPDTEAGKRVTYTLKEFELRLNEMEEEPEEQRRKMISMKKELDALGKPSVFNVHEGAFLYKRANIYKG